MRSADPDRQPVLPAELAERLGVQIGETLVCEPVEETVVQYRQAWSRAKAAIAACVLSTLACAAVVPLTFFAPTWLAVVTGVLGAGLLAASIGLCVHADRRLRSPACLGANCRVEADAFGLRSSFLDGRGTVDLTWPEVVDLGAVYGHVEADGCRDVVAWKVETTRQVRGAPVRIGSYPVPGPPRQVAVTFRADSPNADRIAAAVRQVAEARREGRPLWDPAAVPEGGISRLTGQENPASDAGLSRTRD